MMRTDLIDARVQNVATTRAAWTPCAGAEKRAEKGAFMHSIDGDEAEKFARFQHAHGSSTSSHRPANDFRAV